MKTIIGVASGIGISIVAAFVSYLFQKHAERRRLREQAAFQIYMLLLELNEQYFWIAGKEIHGEIPPREVVVKVAKLTMQIANKLREADDVRYLKEILTVLMSEDAYKSANARARALDVVIDKVGDSVNPRYTKIIRQISDDNVRGFVDRPSGHRENAPGLMR